MADDRRIGNVVTPVAAGTAAAAGALAALRSDRALEVVGAVLVALLVWMAPTRIGVVVVVVASVAAGFQVPGAHLAPLLAWALAVLLFARHGMLYRPKVRMFLAFVALGVIAHASTLPVTVPRGREAVVVSVVALLLAAVAVLAVSVAASPPEIVDGVLCAGGLVLAASLALGVIVPEVAVEMGRLRGPFVNANSLGLLSAVLVAGGLTRRHRIGVLVASMAAATLVWSGSRASVTAALAALLWIVALAVVRRRAWWIACAASIVVAASTAIVTGLAVPDIPLFRSTNSRLAGIEYAVGSVRLEWVGGAGFESSPVEIASTPFRWLHDGGLIALVCVLAAYALMLAVAVGRPGPAGALLVVGFVTSLFEGWLFSGGGTMFIAFWLLYLGLISGPESPARQRRVGVDGQALTVRSDVWLPHDAR
ncbi:hypothetical protein FE697_005705 [Mumia zhuanghuii]|uniref:O-antigen ligase n=2 Tax=Mumia TaxID=1546255 RepID=A0ABW1QI89_9ACTN|nr:MULTISPECIES: hypothetical protein [Mumia]KAA1425349.1 hypothetical protein FE697_005705 [Mumia zhuanghuii]